MEDEAKDAAKDALGGLGDKAKDALGDKLPGGVGDKLSDAAGDLGDKLPGGVGDKLSGAAGGLGDKVTGAAGGLGDAAGGLGGKAAGAVGGVGAAGAGAAAMASGKVGDVGGKVGDMGGKVTGKVGDVGGKVTGSVGDMGGKVTPPKASGGGLMKFLLPLLLLIGLGLLLWWLFTSVLGGDDESDTASAAAASGLEELNVAYFAEWPTPNQYGQADGSFADAVGVPINWIPFTSGGTMSEAMIAGDIDISYSQGLTPFAGAINNGADLKLVGVAVTYADADNCIAQGSLGVTRDNAADTLNGATVMTPFGNVTHYKMLSMMDFLGVDLDSLNIVEAESGATTAAAFETGDIDVGCAFGGSLGVMGDAGGEAIFTGAEQVSDVGISTYDVVSIPTSFGEEHPEVVTSFLAATQEFNDAWAADPDGRNATIAQAAGMEDVGNFLAGPLWFGFPDVEEQLSSDWLAGNVAASMEGQLQTLADLGDGNAPVGDFAGSVDTSFLEAIN